MDDLEFVEERMRNLQANNIELTKRIDKLEKYIEENMSDMQFSDFHTQYSEDISEPSDFTRSAELSELTFKVDKILAGIALEEDRFNIVDRFPKAYVRHMMTSLSVPGLKYFGEKYRPWIHTLLWIFIHLLALLFSYVFIKEEYDEWQKSPVVKTLSNNLTFSKELPFPAVSVCLPFSVNQNFNYAATKEKCFFCNETDIENTNCTFSEACSVDELLDYSIASMMCFHDAGPSMWSRPWYVYQETIEKFVKPEEFLMHAERVFPQCDIFVSHEINMNTRMSSVYNNFQPNCFSRDYQHFASYLGTCFTVNGLRHEDIYKEGTVFSYPKNTNASSTDGYIGDNYTLDNMVYFNGNKNTVPTYIGEDDVMTLIMSDRANITTTEFCSLSKVRALDMIIGNFVLHNPLEVPSVFDTIFTLEVGETKDILVIPELTVTEKGLDHYNPTDRGCFYSTERHLSMFKRYSQYNCKIECIANCSLEICGCVPFFIPRHNESVDICFSECFVLDSVCNCGCLPDCNHLSYSIEQVKRSPKHSQLGYVNLKYKERGLYATVRVGLSNLAQFVAYCLGIVGIFNGFNIMVVFEVLYFLTFKLWGAVKHTLH